MRFAIAAAVLAGCSWVYDAQYDTRADQLEKSRTMFLDGTKQVQFMTSSDNTLYWVDIQQPQGVQALHSYTPASGKKVDYSFPQASSISQAQLHVSDKWIVMCAGTMTAFDATQPNAMIDMSTSGGTVCAVGANGVYFIGEDENTLDATLDRWIPGQGAPVQLADLSTILPSEGSENVPGLGISGNTLVLQTNLGALWTIDLGTLKQTWLMNPDATGNGSVTFDDTGVAYVAAASGSNSTGGPTFTTYAGPASTLIESGIDNGGYDMNFQHSDIQQLDPDNNEFTLTQHHLVYRAKSGIFAYGFDTTKVVDLLLDRKAGDDGFKPLYRTPTVAGSMLFVQDLGDDLSGTADRPVYSVDLTGRLR